VTPLVSILIPAYEAEPWIGDTIRSALAQTWPRTEVIVVDDGSRDGTLAAARAFASRRVQVVTQPNGGTSAARNRALALGQGDYIQWLDADDLLSPDKIERQMAAAVTAGWGERTLLSCGWASFMHRPDRAVFRPTALWADLTPAEWLARKMEDGLHMQTATWLVSRRLTEAAGPWDPSFVVDDDGEYFCRALLASDGVRFVPEGGVFYRMVGARRVSYMGRSPAKLDARFASMRLHIRCLRSLEDSERTRRASVRHLQIWIRHFYPDRMDLVREAERMAAELGGRLTVPRLPWKYEWIRRLAGWGPARQAQLALPRLKWGALRAWDRALLRARRRDPVAMAECRRGRVPEPPAPSRGGAAV
jgi:glycosyltransferase involved in cell wall biosynthesis